MHHDPVGLDLADPFRRGRRHLFAPQTVEHGHEVSAARAYRRAPPEIAARGLDRDLVVRLRLLADPARERGPQLLGRRRGQAQVVDQDDEDATASRAAGDVGRDTLGDGIRRGRGCHRPREGPAFLEADDRLRTSAVEEREVFFRETGDGLAVAVEHDHVDGDGFGLGRERRRRRAGLSEEGRRRGRGKRPRQPRDPMVAAVQAGQDRGSSRRHGPTSSSGSRAGPWPRPGSVRLRGRGSRISRDTPRPSSRRWR